MYTIELTDRHGMVLFHSNHKTARAAMLRLNKLIQEQKIPALLWQIVTPEGERQSLHECYRATYGQEPKRTNRYYKYPCFRAA